MSFEMLKKIELLSIKNAPALFAGVFSLLSFFSVVFFKLFLIIEGIPGLKVNFDFHVISFFVFVICLFMSIVMVGSKLFFDRLIYEKYSSEDESFRKWYWKISFLPGSFIYFLLIAFSLYSTEQYFLFSFSVFCLLLNTIFLGCSIYKKNRLTKISRVDFFEVNYYFICSLFLFFLFGCFRSSGYFGFYDLNENQSTVISFLVIFFYPFIFLLTSFFSSAVYKRRINYKSFSFVFSILLACNFFCFFKIVLLLLKIGGDYPVRLEIRQDIACREYRDFIAKPKICITNPIETKTLRTKKVLLVIDSGNNNFLIKKMQKPFKSGDVNNISKSEIRTVRHSDARIIYEVAR